MLPIQSIREGASATYEFKTGADTHDVDWYLAQPGSRPVLVEVKRRVKDLLEFFDRTLVAGERRAIGMAPQPAHDVLLLFEVSRRSFGKLNRGNNCKECGSCLP